MRTPQLYSLLTPPQRFTLLHHGTHRSSLLSNSLQGFAGRSRSSLLTRTQSVLCGTYVFLISTHSSTLLNLASTYSA
eukprot:scaffold25871_cov19-Prasinocladus_malaysianus.AAC.3